VTTSHFPEDNGSLPERECCEGSLSDWAKDTLAQWLPGYHSNTPNAEVEYKVVQEVDGVYRVEYSDVFREVIGRYRINLTIEEVPSEDDQPVGG
jgi:hypothetical protein